MKQVPSVVREVDAWRIQIIELKFEVSLELQYALA